MGYEILVKTGRTVLENGGVCWDKVKTARCQTKRGAEAAHGAQVYLGSEIMRALCDATTPEEPANAY